MEEVAELSLITRQLLLKKINWHLCSSTIQKPYLFNNLYLSPVLSTSYFQHSFSTSSVYNITCTLNLPQVYTVQQCPSGMSPIASQPRSQIGGFVEHFLGSHSVNVKKRKIQFKEKQPKFLFFMHGFIEFLFIDCRPLVGHRLVKMESGKRPYILLIVYVNFSPSYCTIRPDSDNICQWKSIL